MAMVFTLDYSLSPSSSNPSTSRGPLLHLIDAIPSPGPSTAAEFLATPKHGCIFGGGIIKNLQHRLRASLGLTDKPPAAGEGGGSSRRLLWIGSLMIYWFCNPFSSSIKPPKKKRERRGGERERRGCVCLKAAATAVDHLHPSFFQTNQSL